MAAVSFVLVAALLPVEVTSDPVVAEPLLEIDHLLPAIVRERSDVYGSCVDLDWLGCRWHGLDTWDALDRDVRGHEPYEDLRGLVVERPVTGACALTFGFQPRDEYHDELWLAGVALRF